MPAMQGTHAVWDVAPITGEKEPASHNRGLPSPAVGQKLPAGHALHVLLLEAPIDGDEVPRGQWWRTFADELQLKLPHAV